MVAPHEQINLVAFRVPADLQNTFNQAVAASGGDRTAWLLDALRSKLNQPESNPQSRMQGLVERMELAAAALAGGKQESRRPRTMKRLLSGLLLILSGKGSTMAALSLSGSMRPVTRQKRAKRGIRIFTAPGSARGTTLGSYRPHSNRVCFLSAQLSGLLLLVGWCVHPAAVALVDL